MSVSFTDDLNETSIAVGSFNR